jgi:hypothetical protein
MNRQFLFSLAMICTVSFGVSCQKAVGDDGTISNPPVDTKNSLPKNIKLHYFKDGYTENCSIQYDTANRAIRIFWDDSTTANPFDKLFMLYEYNASGYLIKVQAFEDGEDPWVNTIDRDANNQIRYITDLDGFLSAHDTTFFAYTPSSGGYIIDTKYKEPSSVDPAIIESKYTYSKDWLLQTYEDPNSEALGTYQYTQGLLTGVQFKDKVNSQIIVNLEYNSGLKSAVEDQFLKTICGKDYYIQDIANLCYFNIFTSPDMFILSATDPNHPSRVTRNLKYGTNPVETIITDFTYHLNPAGQVSQLVAVDKYDPFEIVFTY